MRTRTSGGWRWRTALLAGVLSVGAACRSHKAGPHEQALAQAIRAKDVAAAKSALASGVDFDTDALGKDQSPQALLMLLVTEMPSRPGQVDPQLMEIAAAVFAAGADPNYCVFRFPPNEAMRSSSNNPGGPACLINEAVGLQNPALIDLLVKAGLDVKARATSEALLRACRDGYTSMAEKLVAAGADVNYKVTTRRRTETPLSAAVKGHHVPIVDLLDRAGAQEW